MSLQAQIVLDWKNALKNKDPKKDALSMIITELKNRAIKDNVAGDQGRVVEDAIAFEVLQKMAKQRKEAIDAYRTAKRDDLAEKETKELRVVESYLPRPLNDDELREIVKNAMVETKATSIKNLGQVMGASLKQVQGRADGKRVQAMVQTLLGEL